MRQIVRQVRLETCVVMCKFVCDSCTVTCVAAICMYTSFTAIQVCTDGTFCIADVSASQSMSALSTHSG